ncbi:MAG: RDD family protein, partial [Flavobacterium sp.]
TYILDETLLASGGQRFLNYILDFVFVILIFVMLCMFAGILIGLFGLTGLRDWMGALGDLGWNVVLMTIYLSYFFITEGIFGRSIGKLITGTVLVDENGEKPDFGTVVKRSFSRLIPFDNFSYLGSRGWHDSISDTYVVNKKALEEEVKLFHEMKLIGVEQTEL